MSSLIFPASVTVRVGIWQNGQREPYHGRPLVFGVRTFARAKNDIDIGPFFTDEHGTLSITRQQLQLSTRAELSTGIMDFLPVEQAFSLVEILHWSAIEVNNAIRARTSIYQELLDGEAELYGTVPALVAKLRDSGNSQFAPPELFSGRLRDEWTDPARDAEYEYTLVRAPAA